MCGIAGFAGEDQTRIERMVKALAHRGPDGNAVAVEKGASLGHARLAILDPRPIGDQPMWNANRTMAIVYNGEIFNFRQLKEKYRLSCTSGTDTEVILKLYEKKGMDFVAELSGMFAFGIYDARDRSWHLARDPSGIKPLFVHETDSSLAFASEMRALIAGQPVQPELNMRSLSLFLRLQYVPGPETMCQGVESLPPGTVLSWRDGERKRAIIQSAITAPTPKTKTDAMASLPRLMDSVVHDHLIADKPIGLFLSGGMDSSIILHHMRAHTPGKLKTFTVRFDATEKEGAKRFNTDAELAAKTAKHYGANHTEIFLTAEMCRDVYRDAARALDQPNADAVSTAMYALSKAAKEHVDVVLTGAGGDELFGGYPRYRVARILQDLRVIPASLRSQAAKCMGYPPDVLAMSPGAALAARLLARRDNEWTGLTRGNWYIEHAAETLFENRYSRSTDPIKDFMTFDRKLWLVDESLRLTDALTMAHGLEARVPFLDPRVIAAMSSTHSRWHVTERRTKALLKDAYRNILPEHLYTLPKASFYPPLAKWLRRECAPLVDAAIESPWIQELFDEKKLRALQHEHSNGGYHLHVLSAIIHLHCWYEEVYSV